MSSLKDVALWCYKWIGWDWVGSPDGVSEVLMIVQKEKLGLFVVVTTEPRTSPVQTFTLLCQYQSQSVQNFAQQILFEKDKNICHLISLRSFAENGEKVHEVSKCNPSCGYFDVTP